LHCSSNKLTILPDNLNRLTTLNCSSNKLTILPDNLNNLTYLNCDFISLSSYNDLNRNRRLVQLEKNTASTVPIEAVLSPKEKFDANNEKENSKLEEYLKEKKIKYDEEYKKGLAEFELIQKSLRKTNPTLN
jgi:NADPH-dependent curcumin reductase CurA